MPRSLAVLTSAILYSTSVVEVFSEWAGPCKSVLPTFKRIRMEKDDEAALTFLTVKAETCSLLESAKEHKGKSEPLFLLYRNGQLKVKIEGANTPMLSSQILAWTPPNAEMDDLEENPFASQNKALASKAKARK